MGCLVLQHRWVLQAGATRSISSSNNSASKGCGRHRLHEVQGDRPNRQAAAGLGLAERTPWPSQPCTRRPCSIARMDRAWISSSRSPAGLGPRREGVDPFDQLTVALQRPPKAQKSSRSPAPAAGPRSSHLDQERTAPATGPLRSLKGLGWSHWARRVLHSARSVLHGVPSETLEGRGLRA